MENGVQLLDAVLSGGYHVGLIVIVYILWRRMGRLESALAECLQSGGKITPDALDSLEKP